MKSENLPIFSAFALSISCIVVASLVLFALLLFFVGCGCVVGYLSLSDKMKKRAHLFCALSLLGIGVFISNCLTR